LICVPASSAGRRRGGYHYTTARKNNLPVLLYKNITKSAIVTQKVMATDTKNSAKRKGPQTDIAD
jgi:hypothetical protein